MDFELISFKTCPFVQRSAITLLYKNVPFRTSYIDLGDPPDWFKAGQRVVQRKVLTQVERKVLDPAPQGIRLLFSALYTALRVSQYFFYISIAYVLIRSYLFFLVRSCLFLRFRAEFRLPNAT